jgi:hypothetical protein
MHQKLEPEVSNTLHILQCHLELMVKADSLLHLCGGNLADSKNVYNEIVVARVDTIQQALIGLDHSRTDATYLDHVGRSVFTDFKHLQLLGQVFSVYFSTLRAGLNYEEGMNRLRSLVSNVIIALKQDCSGQPIDHENLLGRLSFLFRIEEQLKDSVAVFDECRSLMMREDIQALVTHIEDKRRLLLCERWKTSPVAFRV